MQIDFYHVDAFTDTLFKGNPAGVCILKQSISEDLMQAIAFENNLSETAFVVKLDGGFNIRYFTPAVEVDLCGHATLASAFVLSRYCNVSVGEVVFVTRNVGPVSVFVSDDLLVLNLPSDNLHKATQYNAVLSDALGISPLEVYRGRDDLMAVFDNETQIRAMRPNFGLLKTIDARGIIVTAPGDEAQVTCRFFCPAIGIDEDPVTGSAHTSLVPYWSRKLGLFEFISVQFSERGGRLFCSYKGNRVEVGGKAVLYMKGVLSV